MTWHDVSTLLRARDSILDILHIRKCELIPPSRIQPLEHPNETSFAKAHTVGRLITPRPSPGYSLFNDYEEPPGYVGNLQTRVHHGDYLAL